MKTKTLRLLFGLSFLCLFASLWFILSGCATGNGRYDPSTHLYDTNAPADKVVVTAQNARATALEAFDLFVTAEAAFADQLWKLSPEVKHAADNIRLNSGKWLDDLTAQIDAYQRARTADDQLKLQSAIDLLTLAESQARSYVAQLHGLNPAPPAAATQ